MKRRDFAAVVFVMFGLQAGASAQSRPQASDSDYPSRPIRMIIGNPPGGGSDLLARVVTNEISKGLRQRVIIDNRPGAGHTIASEIVTKALPNGYTVQWVNGNFTLNPYVYGNLPYDTERDFAPVTQLVTQPLVLVVNTSFPVGSVKDLIAMARAKPGALSASTSGTAGAAATTTAMFKLQTGTDYVIVPYQGGAQAMLALLQGEVQFYFSTTATGMETIRSGKIKVLATSSNKRLPYLPDVPTLMESGLVGLDIAPWDGIVAPAKTPRVIIDRLHRELVKALAQPNVSAHLTASGSEPIGSTPDEFAAEIKRQLELFGRLFKAGIIKRQ